MLCPAAALLLPCCCPQDASSSLERLRTDLRSWTTRVEAGELQNIGQKEPSAGELELMLGVCSTSRRGGGVDERLGGGAAEVPSLGGT